MRRATILPAWFAAALWLSLGAILVSPPPAVADDAVEDAAEGVGQGEERPAVAEEAVEAAAEPEAAEKKAERTNPILKGLGAVIKRAVNAFRRPARAMPAGRIVPGGLNVVNNDQLIKQFEAQYALQFRQLYKTELHFIRVVCRPTKPQYEKIAVAGETVLKGTIRNFATVQHARQRGNWVVGEQPTTDDPRQLIGAGLANLVKSQLSAEQSARYRRELDKRAAARKRVALLNVVAHLDKRLVLSPDQRTRLTETLDANWNESWNEMQRLMNMDHYCPQLPDEKVLPLLNETQQAVWRGMPKQGTVHFGFHMWMVQGVEIEEAAWDEAEPAAANEDGKPEADE